VIHIGKEALAAVLEELGFHGIHITKSLNQHYMEFLRMSRGSSARGFSAMLQANGEHLQGVGHHYLLVIHGLVAGGHWHLHPADYLSAVSAIKAAFIEWMASAGLEVPQAVAPMPSAPSEVPNRLARLLDNPII
jgi:hypothetical protein